jgi:hypothetical protein
MTTFDPQLTFIALNSQLESSRSTLTVSVGDVDSTEGIGHIPAFILRTAIGSAS